MPEDSTPEITFSEDLFFKNMGQVFINKKRTHETFPKWLFDGLSEIDKSVAYEMLREMILLGYREGQKNKKEKLRRILGELNTL